MKIIQSTSKQTSIRYIKYPTKHNIVHQYFYVWFKPNNVVYNYNNTVLGYIYTGCPKKRFRTLGRD